MCGRARYSALSVAKIDQLTHSTAGQESEKCEDNKIENTFIENLSPGMSVPVIYPKDGRFEVEKMKWGLIPKYEAKLEKPNYYRLFNKRIESIGNSNKYFDALARTNRCVVIFDGFYEWKGKPGSKQPHYVSVVNEPIMIPAIFETTKDEDLSPSDQQSSFTLFTCDASDAVKELHDRQPVIIDEVQMGQWLDPKQPAHHLLLSFNNNRSDSAFQQAHPLKYFPINKRMTDSHYQALDCSSPAVLGSPKQDIRKHFEPKCSPDSRKRNVDEANEDSPLRSFKSRRF